VRAPSEREITRGRALLRDLRRDQPRRARDRGRLREARCSCAPGNLLVGCSEEQAALAREQGRIRPSSLALEGRLAFFEYHGPGSRSARDRCARCGYSKDPHERVPISIVIPSKLEGGQSWRIRESFAKGATDDDVRRWLREGGPSGLYPLLESKRQRPLSEEVWDIDGCEIKRDRLVEIDHDFEPYGDGLAFDSFYCGHGGWD
jgi:hypothetical protein